MENLDEIITEEVTKVEEKISDAINKETPVIKPDDWFGRHNFFSRLIMLAVTGILIYAFVVPLEATLVTIIAWLTFGIFVLISVGINSLQTIGDIIIKFKKG